MKNLFTGTNIKLLAIGLVLLIIGFICLAQGPVDNPLSLSVAPFILVICYCVIIPVAIILKPKKEEKK